MAYRDRVREKFVHLLRGEGDKRKEEGLEIALRLEDEIYRLFKAGKPYCDKSRSVIFNLSDPKNPKPVKMLLSEQVTPENFLKIDPLLWASEDTLQTRENHEMNGMWEKRSDWEAEEVKMQGESYTGLFLCESCGSNKTGFIQVQVDRADEPMHCFIYCYECKARFTKH